MRFSPFPFLLFPFFTFALPHFMRFSARLWIFHLREIFEYEYLVYAANQCFSSFLFIFFLRFNDSALYANTLQAGHRLFAGYLHAVHTYSSICQLHFWANINATITIYCGQNAPRKIRVNMRGKCKLQITQKVLQMHMQILRYFSRVIKRLILDGGSNAYRTK